jgi:DHA1 family tetracycline resistance protein-like MFS transporter
MLAVLFGVVIVDLIGFGIVMPVLPFYAKEYGASATVLGLLLMVHAAAQFLAAPLWGRLSDKIGRRPVMLMTIAGTTASLLLLGFAGSLFWIFAARILSGAFAANISVASAYISDITEEHERTRWMGVLGACFGVGFVLGPIIGGGLAPYGYAVPMLVAAGIAAANLVHAAVRLKEPEGHVLGAAIDEGRLSVLSDPDVRRLCLSYFAFSVAVSQLETVFAFFMIDRFAYDAREVAFLLVAMAIVMGGVQGGGMKALSARYRERSMIVAGSALLGVALFAVPEVPNVAVLLVVLLVAAFSRAIVHPSLLSLTSQSTTATNRGAVMGTFQSSASLARVVGPVAAGLLYDVRIALPFWLAAALLVGVVAVGRGLPEPTPETVSEAS